MLSCWPRVLCFPYSNYDHCKQHGIDGFGSDLGMQRSGSAPLSFAHFGPFISQQGFDSCHLFFHLLLEHTLHGVLLLIGWWFERVDLVRDRVVVIGLLMLELSKGTRKLLHIIGEERDLLFQLGHTLIFIGVDLHVTGLADIHLFLQGCHDFLMEIGIDCCQLSC